MKNQTFQSLLFIILFFANTEFMLVFAATPAVTQEQTLPTIINTLKNTQFPPDQKELDLNLAE